MSQACLEQKTMSPVNPSTFGLQDDVPDTPLDSEWCALVSQPLR